MLTQFVDKTAHYTQHSRNVALFNERIIRRVKRKPLDNSYEEQLEIYNLEPTEANHTASVAKPSQKYQPNRLLGGKPTVTPEVTEEQEKS